MTDKNKNDQTPTFESVTEQYNTLRDAPLNEMRDSIKDRVAIDDEAYLQKLVELRETLGGRGERSLREMDALKLLSDEEFELVVAQGNISADNIATHPTYLVDSITYEQRRRDFRDHNPIIKSRITLKKDDCCDGTMIEFRKIATVCIAPQNFTEVHELLGDQIVINGSDKPLPKRLAVTLGDAKHNNVGGRTDYYNRSIMPHWFRHFLDTEVADDPSTVETRKAIWEQMLNAVVKKKDRKNPSAIFLEKTSPIKRKLDKKIKAFMKTQNIEINDDLLKIIVKEAEEDVRNETKSVVPPDDTLS